MNDLFFRNPRLLILTASLILVAGLSSLFILPRMEDPILTQRVALVNTVFPGADAARVEALVADEFERSLRDIDEIKEVRSDSRANISTIKIELDDNVYEVDEVWSRVRDKIDEAQLEFPAGVAEPEFRRLDMKAYALIVALQWQSSTPTNYAALIRQAEELEALLLNLNGTEKVRLFGDPDEEFVAELDPEKAASLGLTAAEVAEQIKSSDAKVAAGQFRGAETDLLLEVSGEFDSMNRIANTPIRIQADGRVMRLKEIATLKKGIVEPASSLALVDGQDAILLGVLVRDNKRIDHWTADATAAIQEFAQQLPAGIALQTVSEQNLYVTDRLQSLAENLVLGCVGILLVIFLLMGWRSALIVGVALPLSSLMVIAGLRFLDIPIHQMSVTGLIIALGLLIDNAIVMVDEVSAKLIKNPDRRAAVATTVRGLAIPLLGSTVTTALAFAPLALMPGPTGEFVGSIAISVIMAIFSSLFVSLTIIATLSGWFLQTGGRQLGTVRNPSTWRNVARQGLVSAQLSAVYDRTLKAIFARPILGVGLGVFLPIAGFLAATQLPEQFFPPSDRDQFQIELELSGQASLDQTKRVALGIRAAVLERPEVKSVDWVLGESVPTFYYNVVPRREQSSNYAQAIVQTDLPLTPDSLIRELQATLDRQFPQARVLVRLLEQGPPFDAPIEVRISGPDRGQLKLLATTVRNELAALPGVSHTRADVSESIPKVRLNVDEEKARQVGLTPTAIAAQLQSSLEGTTGGSLLESTEELPVRVRFGNQDRSQLERISSINLATAQGLVPLTAVASVSLSPESSVLTRLDGRRIHEVKGYTQAGVLPGPIVKELQHRLSDVTLPGGYDISFGGEAKQRQAAVGNLLANVGILGVLMVATLVLSFGSFRMAGIIGLVAGLSLGLGMLALWLFSYPFGFMAIIGSMGLMGVAVNDAIVVLAGIQANESAKAGDRDAIRHVVNHATRHIVATSLTSMAGFAPMVLAGGEFWPPLAVAISGGVAGATLLALYFVPSMYLIVMCRATADVANRCLSLSPVSRPQRAPGLERSEPSMASA